MIFALIALLIVYVLMDFQTTSERPPVTSNAIPVATATEAINVPGEIQPTLMPTVTPLAVAAAQTRIVITATPVTPIPTALPAIQEIPPGTVDALLVTLTAMANIPLHRQQKLSPLHRRYQRPMTPPSPPLSMRAIWGSSRPCLRRN